LLSIVNQAGNNHCADCGSAKPEWASINLGITLCIHCAGVHRGLGAHISKVRSIVLDDWDLADIKFLQTTGNVLGNQTRKVLVLLPLMPDDDTKTRETFITAKYPFESASETPKSGGDEPKSEGKEPKVKEGKRAGKVKGDGKEEGKEDGAEADGTAKNGEAGEKKKYRANSIDRAKVRDSPNKESDKEKEKKEKRRKKEDGGDFETSSESVDSSQEEANGITPDAPKKKHKHGDGEKKKKKAHKTKEVKGV